jgi:hypothetical protein
MNRTYLWELPRLLDSLNLERSPDHHACRRRVRNALLALRPKLQEPPFPQDRKLINETLVDARTRRLLVRAQ